MTYNVLSGTLNPTHFTSPKKILKVYAQIAITNLNRSSAVAEMSDRSATIYMAEKWGLWCPHIFVWGRGAGSTSNTMWPGLRLTSIPSGILIHPTVWPQYTNVTDRQDRTDRRDNGPIA